MATPSKNLPAAASNVDAPVKSEVVDVSSNDYTPTGNQWIRGLNVSVAGVIYLVDLNGVTAPEYVNTGWQPCTVCVTIKHHNSNTATVLKAALASLSA